MSVLFSKKRHFTRQFVSALVIFMVTFSAFSPAVFAEDTGTSTPTTTEVEGCTDADALNYDDEATIDDGSCEFPPVVNETASSTDDTASSTDETTDENDGDNGENGTDTPSATTTASSTPSGDDDGDGGTEGGDGEAGDPGTGTNVTAEAADEDEPIPVVAETELGEDTADGEDGEDNTGEKHATGTNSTVITGPAKAQGEVSTDVNSNLIRSEAPSPLPSDLDSYIFTATGTNEATVKTDGSAEAVTGYNSADATGKAKILTGDAIAGVNIANIVNSNVVNSDGFLYLKNQVPDPDEALDLSSFFFPDPDETIALSDDCTLLSCYSEDVQYNFLATNTAEITNIVDVEAITGVNRATSSSALLASIGSINTGSARGGANVINVVNTNIVDSNYRLLTYNAMGDLNDDLILPTEELFRAFFSRPNGISQLENSDDADKSVWVENDNTANVDNDLKVTAETGDNHSKTFGVDSVGSGNGYAESNILNKINQNVFGGDSLHLQIHVHGDWTGELRGLPAGLDWTTTSVGYGTVITIFNTEAEIAPSPALPCPGGVNQPGECLDEYVAEYTNLNTVEIKNDITIDATTGRNKMVGNGTIQTGDAYASANLMNIANTNVIGTNWTYAVINIFGDFDGDVSFGSSGVDTTDDDDDDTDPEELPGGGTGTTTGTSTDPIDATATTTATSTPPVVIDTTPAPSSNPGGGGGGGNPKKTNTKKVERVVEEVDPKATPFLVIEKSANVDEDEVVLAGEEVDYTITVTNRGGQAYNATVYDTLKNPIGAVISEDSWDLGTILAGEVIELEYTTAYDFKTPSGEYTNTAKVVAYRTADGKTKGDDPLKISEAVHKIEIKGVPLAVGNVGVLAVFPGANGTVSALVAWETSKQALSQVFYGQKLAYSVFNEKFFNFGYPQKSFKFSTPKDHHLMIISGLQPGAEYSYRIDAHTNEHDAVSREYTFTVPVAVTSLSINIGDTFLSTAAILGRVAGAATTAPRP